MNQENNVDREIEVSPEYKKNMQTEALYDATSGKAPQSNDPYYMEAYLSVKNSFRK